MKRAIVKVTKTALAAVFAPGGKIMGVRERDEDFQNNTISLDVEADWCPEVKEGDALTVVQAPAPRPPKYDDTLSQIADSQRRSAERRSAETAIRNYRYGLNELDR